MTKDNLLKKAKEEFDKEFVRDDGLMDKYHYDKDANPIFKADAIKSFLEEKLSLAYSQGQQDSRQEIRDMVGSMKEIQLDWHREVVINGKSPSLILRKMNKIEDQNEILSDLLTQINKLK